MANAILTFPPEYQVAPVVSQDELEDLIVQVDPQMDQPESDSSLRSAAVQLRAAVEQLLLAYRQSIYLGEHGASLSPAQHCKLAETIAFGFQQAWAYAEAMPTVVTPALELFLKNMDIDGGESDACARYH